MCKEKQGVVEKDHDEDGAVVVMQMIKDGQPPLHRTDLAQVLWQTEPLCQSLLLAGLLPQ